MRKIVLSIAVVLVTTSVALADWSEIFRDIYTEKGIDEAVVSALSEGYSTDQIMKTSLPIEGLQEEELVNALFCALVPLDTIYNTALANGILEEKITTGYELALKECPDAMEEKLTAAAPQSRTLAPSQNTNSSNIASPSNFQ